MNKELLSNTIESLCSMIDYANDETISEDDIMYKDFFEELNKAKKVLEELYKLYKECEEDD